MPYRATSRGTVAQLSVSQPLSPIVSLHFTSSENAQQLGAALVTVTWTSRPVTLRTGSSWRGLQNISRAEDQLRVCYTPGKGCIPELQLWPPDECSGL